MVHNNTCQKKVPLFFSLFSLSLLKEASNIYISKRERKAALFFFGTTLTGKKKKKTKKKTKKKRWF